MDDELQTMTKRKVGHKGSSFRLESSTRGLHTTCLFVFQFHSLSLQKLGVLRSICCSLEMYTLRVISYIITPFSSVPKLSLKAEVKGISYLPVLHCHNKAGKFSHRLLKKPWLFPTSPSLKFLMIQLLYPLQRNCVFMFYWWRSWSQRQLLSNLAMIFL